MVTPAAKREAVAHLRVVHEMSERRACRLIGCQRMTVRATGLAGVAIGGCASGWWRFPEIGKAPADSTGAPDG